MENVKFIYVETQNVTVMGCLKYFRSWWMFLKDLSSWIKYIMSDTVRNKQLCWVQNWVVTILDLFQGKLILSRNFETIITHMISLVWQGKCCHTFFLNVFFQVIVLFRGCGSGGEKSRLIYNLGFLFLGVTCRNNVL